MLDFLGAKMRMKCKRINLQKTNIKREDKVEISVWKNVENEGVYFPVDWRYCWCKAINLAINCWLHERTSNGICSSSSSSSMFHFDLLHHLRIVFWTYLFIFFTYSVIPKAAIVILAQCAMRFHIIVCFASLLFVQKQKIQEKSTQMHTHRPKTRTTYRRRAVSFFVSHYYLPRQITSVSFSVLVLVLCRDFEHNGIRTNNISIKGMRIVINGK